MAQDSPPPASGYAAPMTPAIVSAASRPTPAPLPVRRAPLSSRTQSGEVPDAVARLLATGAGATPIVAAFQSSV